MNLKDIDISLISVKSALSALHCAFYRLKIDAIFTEIIGFKVCPFYSNFANNSNMEAIFLGSEMPMSILTF